MATTRKRNSEAGRRSSPKPKSARRATAAHAAGSHGGSATSTPATPPKIPTTAADAADRFVRDLQVRGEAARPDSSGKLALSATHAITQEKDGVVKVVKRARFKAY